MMQISSVGYLFDSEEEVIENAIKATKPSHNSEEALECSVIIARIIYLACCGFNKNEIIEKLNLSFEFNSFTEFNLTCSAPICNYLYALFSSDNFNDAIKKVISFGGDTDTNACIVGSMAEALYGIDQSLIKQASEKIPKSFIEKLENAYLKISNLRQGL